MVTTGNIAKLSVMTLALPIGADTPHRKPLQRIQHHAKARLVLRACGSRTHRWSCHPPNQTRRPGSAVKLSWLTGWGGSCCHGRVKRWQPSGNGAHGHGSCQHGSCGHGSCHQCVNQHNLATGTTWQTRWVCHCRNYGGELLVTHYGRPALWRGSAAALAAADSSESDDFTDSTLPLHGSPRSVGGPAG